MIDKNNKIIYVSGDGTGDLNVIESMKYSANTVINNAINYVKNHPSYTTVYLKGTFTYYIDGPIHLCSDLELTGDSTAVIKLVDSANWKQMIPLIGPYNESLNNINIHGFEIDGNYDGNYEDKDGKLQVAPNVNKSMGYYNFMYFAYSTNISIYNMYLHDGHNDGVRVANCENVFFYNNTVKKLGHDGFFAIRSKSCHAYNNIVAIRSNSAIRMNDCLKSSIHDNEMWAYATEWDAGNAGIMIERQYKNDTDVDIYNNKIHDTYGCGILLRKHDNAITESGNSKVYIHHNMIYGCGLNPNIYNVGGIVNYSIHNAIVENNVVDKCYGHGIVCMGLKDDDPAEVSVLMYVRNNIVMNTLVRQYQPIGTGYGICNRLKDTHKMYVNNNCVYNNKNGAYLNVKATNDITTDPLCVDPDNHDYHLESLAGRWDVTQWVKDTGHSPCIDAGYVESSVGDEQSPNGGKINIGLYGGTKYASKSVTDEPDIKLAEDIADEIIEVPDEEIDVPDNVEAELEPVELSVIETTIYPVFNNRLKDSTPDNVLKAHTYIDVGALAGRVYRGLEYFDLAEFDNKEILKAELQMYWYYPENKKRQNDTVVEIYRPVKFASGYTTWNTKTKKEKWENAGGDWFDKEDQPHGGVPFASITIDGSKVPTDSYYSFDITDLIKAYSFGTYENTGIFIKAKDEDSNYIAFYNGNMPQTNKKLKLNITYRG